MFKRTLIISALAMTLSAPAFAGHCPLDAKAIDSALSRMMLSEMEKTEIMALRDEGIRYVSVRREGKGLLALLRSAEDRDRTLNLIRSDQSLQGLDTSELEVGENFGISATDPDSDPLTLAHTPLPTGASFVDNGNGTGTFDWTPDSTQEGNYSVTFQVTDTAGGSDFETVAITVTRTNVAPILASIGPRSVSESVNLNFGVSASDLDADIPVLTTSALPTGAVFTDNFDGTGNFDWMLARFFTQCFQVLTAGFHFFDELSGKLSALNFTQDFFHFRLRPKKKIRQWQTPRADLGQPSTMGTRSGFLHCVPCTESNLCRRRLAIEYEACPLDLRIEIGSYECG